MDWINRNLLLLIGGVVLLPLSIFTSLMSLAFGVGFSDDKSTAFYYVGLLASYIIVFFTCWALALKRYKRKVSYGYWDIVPIFYFVGVFVLLFME